MSTHKKEVMYVYKLNTKNHPSTPPTTTIKKSITRTLGALLHRSNLSKTYKNHHNSTQEVVIDIEGGRRSLPTVETVEKVEKTDLVIEKGRKTVSGAENWRNPGSGMAVAGRRAVERVLVADMPVFMQVHAFRCARQTFDSLEKFSPKQIAFNIKKDFDKVYGPAWHCIVGSSFGSFVTHATGCFLYFSMEKLHILVFKTKVQKNVNFSN